MRCSGGSSRSVLHYTGVGTMHGKMSRSTHSLLRCLRLMASALLLLPFTAVAFTAPDYASSSSGCADLTPYKWLPNTAPWTARAVNPLAAEELAQKKALLTAGDPALQADLLNAASSSGDLTTKMRMMASLRNVGGVPVYQSCGGPADRGSLLRAFESRFVSDVSASDTVGYWTDNGYPGVSINWLNQQAQNTYYYCGPATIAEETTTEGVGIAQSTAASDMGTTSSNGTSAGAMQTEMRNRIGWPVMGWQFYYWVGVSGSPTSTEISTFENNVWTDLYGGAPVSGDAYEASGRYKDGTPYPHLNGHPNLTIKHWFEIGGEDQNGWGVYYADSVYGTGTSIFNPDNVPQYSWLGAYWTNSYGDPLGIVEILGGLGYIW
jgi:hypothetical protein